MDASCIDYSETGFFSRTIINYLDDDANLKPFYNQRPTMEGFGNLIGSKNYRGNRQLLATVLYEQYQRISEAGLIVDKAVSANIESLKLDNTYTVTTGHQLNIFTGPLYFIYKIATAIKLSAQLKERFPAQNFVPVYWMASEDHDFAEINYVKIGGKKIQWGLDASGATGRLLTKTIREALNQYKGILGIEGNALELAEMVETAYTKFNKLADATRYLVNALFGEYGLVIIDADDVRLKRQFAPIMEQDIVHQHSFKNIGQNNAALQKLGAHIQVNPREINFFYLTDGLRERIVLKNGFYEILNTDIQFTEEGIKQEIAQHPERFSPNVVMRPLYQEVILPNLAYIGGGAEIVYWLQLKTNFDFYQVDFPILVLRNSGLIIPAREADKIKKLGFGTTDIFKDTETLKKLWITRHSAHNLTLAHQREQLQTAFDDIKNQVAPIDPTLPASAEAVYKRMAHALDNLEKKMMRSEKRSHEVRLNHIGQVKSALFPGESLQERSENFGLFYTRWGRQLIAELISNFEPLDFKFTVLVEGEG